MLKERSWRSLYKADLKNATRMHFLSEDSFETLRRKVRAEETEMATDKTATGSPAIVAKHFTPKVQHQPVLHDSNKKAINDLSKRLISLEKTIQSLAKVIQQPKENEQ